MIELSYDESPVRSSVQTVEPGWIDYNGHMNVAYYTMAFDRALDDVYEALGVGETAAREQKQGPMALQSQIFYLAELTEGQRFVCDFRLLDADAKRLHVFMEMRNLDDGEALAATYESLSLNVDLTERRSAPYSDAAQARIRKLLDAHYGLPRPEQAGRTIGIRRKG